MKKIILLLIVICFAFGARYINTSNKPLYFSPANVTVAKGDTVISPVYVTQTGFTFLDYKGTPESVIYSNVITFPIGGKWRDTLTVDYANVDIISIIPNDTIRVWFNDTTVTPLKTSNIIEQEPKLSVARIIIELVDTSETTSVEVHMTNKKLE